MAYSIQTAVSNGTLEVLDLSIKYMDKSHIFVYVDDVLVDGSAYSYVWLTDTRIQVVPAVANGSTLKVIRKTLTDEMWHEFSKGARFSTTSMDENFEQLLFLAQEYSEGIYVSDFYSDIDLHLKRILNLGDPINEGDAVNLKTLREYLPYGPAAASLAARITQEEAKTAELAAPNGAAHVGFVQPDGSTTTVQAKLRATISVVDYGASVTGTTTANKVALQLTITKVDAAGGGVLIVPNGIDYGFKNTDPTTYPDFTGCNNDIIVIDHGIGDADGSGNKAGAQVRTFYYTKQTTPVGQHDGNGTWIYGAWHPYYSVNNTAQLAAPSAPSRAASDNRRASILFNNDGKSTWRFGQGTLAGAGYTDEELSNFVLEHYQATGDTLPNYAPLTIERKTGNWSIGGGTNAPLAMLSVKNASAGYWTALFESLATTVETRLRNSNGSGDDVAVKNVSGDLVLNIPALGDALTVKKTNRNIAIGSNGNYRLDVADTQAAGYVANFKNNSTANGSGVIIETASAPSTGFQHLLAMANNGADVQFRLRGDGNGYCDGSWSGGGADYAEFFEWVDGNPAAEDRRGVCVTLVGNKIMPAKDGDSIIGVVSTNPSVVGDSAWNHWAGKYLRDEYGSMVLDENGQRVINPEFDEGAEYTPREHRKEWACIGLIGKLRVRKDQPVDSRWVKMRDISDSVVEYFVR